jgi:type I restriction enzyme S subunit
MPSKEEQLAIGSFFRKFDKQIVAQQAKLDKLNLLKQAYLQKMFV